MVPGEVVSTDNPAGNEPCQRPFDVSADTPIVVGAVEVTELDRPALALKELSGVCDDRLHIASGQGTDVSEKDLENVTVPEDPDTEVFRVLVHAALPCIHCQNAFGKTGIGESHGAAAFP